MSALAVKKKGRGTLRTPRGDVGDVVRDVVTVYISCGKSRLWDTTGPLGRRQNRGFSASIGPRKQVALSAVAWDVTWAPVVWMARRRRRVDSAKRGRQTWRPVAPMLPEADSAG